MWRLAAMPLPWPTALELMPARPGLRSLPPCRPAVLQPSDRQGAPHAGHHHARWVGWPPGPEHPGPTPGLHCRAAALPAPPASRHLARGACLRRVSHAPSRSLFSVRLPSPRAPAPTPAMSTCRSGGCPLNSARSLPFFFLFLCLPPTGARSDSYYEYLLKQWLPSQQCAFPPLLLPVPLSATHRRPVRLLLRVPAQAVAAHGQAPGLAARALRAGHAQRARQASRELRWVAPCVGRPCTVQGMRSARGRGGPQWGGCPRRCPGCCPALGGPACCRMRSALQALQAACAHSPAPGPDACLARRPRPAPRATSASCGGAPTPSARPPPCPRRLLRRTAPPGRPGLWYLAEEGRRGRLSTKMDHLVCFLPGEPRCPLRVRVRCPPGRDARASTAAADVTCFLPGKLLLLLLQCVCARQGGGGGCPPGRGRRMGVPASNALLAVRACCRGWCHPACAPSPCPLASTQACLHWGTSTE